MRDQYLTGQLEKGGWSYKRGGQATYSMSCASLCGLLIADSEIGQASDESKKAGERGFQWLEENDSLDVQRASYYNLYVTARLGALSKKKTFGKRDWFRDGAEWLFQQQQENGSFQGKAIDLSVPISTSFALLFLSSQP